MSDSHADDEQVVAPIATLPNHIPYILQRLKEYNDLIQADTTYEQLSSPNNEASQEDTASNVEKFKLAFQHAIDTLGSYASFALATQNDWEPHFENMRQAMQAWPNQEYYTHLIERAYTAFMDVVEWIKTSDEASAHEETYSLLFDSTQ
jgi:hypothetical protein